MRNIMYTTSNKIFLFCPYTYALLGKEITSQVCFHGLTSYVWYAPSFKTVVLTIRQCYIKLHGALVKLKNMCVIGIFVIKLYWLNSKKIVNGWSYYIHRNTVLYSSIKNQASYYIWGGVCVKSCETSRGHGSHKLWIPYIRKVCQRERW